MLNTFSTSVLFVLCSVNLWAADPKPAAAGAKPATSTTPASTSTDNPLVNYLVQSREATEQASLRSSCAAQSREFREQLAKFNDYCEEVRDGGGSSDCVSTMNRCKDEIADLADGVNGVRENSESLRALQNASQNAASAEGGMASMLLSSVASTMGDPTRGLASLKTRCPRMGSKDYDSKYRDIKNDIKDTDNKIRDEKKDILKKQSELESDQQKITEDSKKAKTSYEKAKLDMERKRQEQSERNFENAQKAQKTLGELKTRSMKLDMAYQAALKDESSTTLQYLAYAEKNIKASCKVQVEKQRKEIYSANPGKNQQNSINLIKKGSEMNQTLMNIFNACYAAQDQKLKNDLEEKRNKKLEIQDAIKNMEDEKHRLEDALANADDSNKKLNESYDKETSNNEQSYMDDINALQQRLTNAASKFQREQARSTADLNQLNSELQTSKVDLASLGPRPVGDSDSVGFNAATRAYKQAYDVATEYANNCGCNAITGKKPTICEFAAKANRTEDDPTPNTTPARGTDVQSTPRGPSSGSPSRSSP